MIESQEEVAAELKGIIVSSPHPLTVRDLARDYVSLVGTQIPYQRFGYRNLYHYLTSIPQTLIVNGTGDNAHVHAVLNAKTAHIAQMVSNQNTKRTKPRGGRRPPPSRCNSYNNNFISNHTQQPQNKSSQQNWTNRTPPGLSYAQPQQFCQPPKPTIIYNQQPPKPTITYNQKLRQPTTVYNQETAQQSASCIRDVGPALSFNSNSKPYIPQQQQPEAQRGRSQQRTKPPDSSPLVEMRRTSPVMCSTTVRNRTDANDVPSLLDDRNNTTPLPHSPSVGDSDSGVTSLPSNYYKFNISAELQDNLRSLIAQHPDGILVNDLHRVYQEKFGVAMEYSTHKYPKLLAFCAELSHILTIVPADRIHFKVVDVRWAGSVDMLSPYAIDEPSTDAEHTATMTMVEAEDILRHFMRFGDSIPRINVEHVTTEDDYFDLRVAEVYDPSKFWIQVISEECSEAMDRIMNAMQIFYNDNVEGLEVPAAQLKRGMYCAIFYYNVYNRAIIVEDNVPGCNPPMLKAFFIDYGSVGVVPKTKIYYLHESFGALKAQAIRARLEKLCPPVAHEQWPKESSKAFFELVDNKPLVGRLISTDVVQNVMNLVLTNTLTDIDVHIDDELCKAGHAITDGETPTPASTECRYVPTVPDLHMYPTFDEIELGIVPSGDVTMKMMRDLYLPVHQIYPHYFVLRSEMRARETGEAGCSNTDSDATQQQQERVVADQAALGASETTVSAGTCTPVPCSSDSESETYSSFRFSDVDSNDVNGGEDIDFKDSCADSPEAIICENVSGGEGVQYLSEHESDTKAGTVECDAELAVASLNQGSDESHNLPKVISETVEGIKTWCLQVDDGPHVPIQELGEKLINSRDLMTLRTACVALLIPVRGLHGPNWKHVFEELILLKKIPADSEWIHLLKRDHVPMFIEALGYVHKLSRSVA